jgi:hypothetical protein
MADETIVPKVVSRVEVELMIEKSLKPIHKTLTEMHFHNLSMYGNGSGRKGYLEKMEAKQDKRWEDQLVTNQSITGELVKIRGTLKSGAAVVRDRKWMVTTILMAVPVCIDLYFKLKGAR